MALIKTIMAHSGIEISYWKITDWRVNQDARAMDIVLTPYISSQSRSDGYEPLRDEGAIITFATNLTEPLNLILTNNETQEIIFGSFNTEKTTLNLPAGTYILKQINNPTIILNSISLENEIEVYLREKE